MQLSDVAKLIKGPAGTNVSITIMRGKEEITKTIKREKIKIASVESSIKGNIGVISIYSFSNDTYKLFKAAATEMTNKNPKAIIIDLRSNPGGYLTTAMQIADYFLPKGTVISKLDFPNKASADKTYLEEQAMNPHRVARNNDTEIEYHSMGSGELSRHRVIILQNGGSASASEILAAAIRDNGKGTVIGENSFGKGSVQELIDYNDDSQFKMSIAKWLTPKGINLSKNPIVPDVIVKDDPKKDGDEVMNKALEMAQ
jgi:carboxyl-terminal processing protease